MKKISGSIGGVRNQSAMKETPPEAMAQVQALKEAVEANPNDVQTIVQLANLYFDVAKFEQAIRYYKQALQLEPTSTNVLIDIGVAYFNTGKGDSSLAFMHKALDINPDHKQGLYNIGIVYYNMNNIDKAIHYWEELIRKYPQSEEARNAQNFIGQIKKQAKS